ncbi:TetR/AcrR family transcriptional regulator [Nocardiopsis algeriensis]|uniref:AcrR family transcriptional regulator n=1 Tax=Nocardiopsis algeriensis TaxID=1478215 RepID=A0A841IR38_9ACTN|nr:TetR/AcrR family transcriptional regulator [Nocardiopsis algeriensis]MBB6118688.1 AcrR family transcriptional regulator [Nocardiopsis algeriensis]
MSSATPPGNPDLTARARIRDAAVVCFGNRGFDVSVRTIAEAAGVSPGLVIHHFGSKEALRKACDDHVAATIDEVKTEGVTAPDSGTLIEQFATAEEYAHLVAYVFRSMQAGGDLARTLFDRMVADVERYMAAGEAAGTIRPTRDPKARALWMTASSLGALVLLVNLRHPGPDVDFREVVREWQTEHALPVLEVYTEGLFPDSTALDAYLAHKDGAT